MVLPITGRFLLRLVKRWQTVSLLLVMSVLLWLGFLAADNRTSSSPSQQTTQVKDESGPHSAPRLLAKAPAEINKQKKFPLDFRSAIETDNDDIVSPIVRRGPVPNVNYLAAAMPDEENAAHEVVDNVKHTQSGQSKSAAKLDDNAAREEHSREIDLRNGKNKKIKKVEKHVKENPKSVKEVEEQEESFHQLPEHQKELPEDKYGSYNNWRNLTNNEINKLSILGRRLFLNEKIGSEQNKIYKIHVWKYLKYIERRLLRRYTRKNIDPFEGCSVSNCQITSEDEQVTEADAVLFHLHRITGPPDSVPRKPHQLWVWMSDESPYNVFMVAKDRKLSHYSGYFNWSMSYRMDADVPVPYGRTEPLPKDQYLDHQPNYFKEKAGGLAILGSNCHSRNMRYEYIKEMQNYIPVDIYGRCGPLECPGHFNVNCPLLDSYKFYLAFENSNCDDYVTEKVFWNALSKGAVPVVMGASYENYKKLLPPDSFIFAEQFDGPQHLASYLKQLLSNPAQYHQYHRWRHQYRVINEHGYFQTPVRHFCRLCEALNYNDRKPSHSANLENYYDPQNHCYPPKKRN